MNRRSDPRGVFPRFSVSDDVRREIQLHLDQRAEELVAEGWEPTAARTEALRLFGDVDAVSRRCQKIARKRERAVRRGKMLDALAQDIRFGLRMLARSPAFTAVAIVTLGLGIGANTAVFSVVNGIVLKPLPYKNPDALVWIREVSRGGGLMAVAWPNFRDWKEQATSLDGISVFSSISTTVLGGPEPTTATAAAVGEDFWRVFPVSPVEGRLTAPADHRPGAQTVALVSQSFWENELGALPLTEYSLEVLGTHVQVVGVLPDGFDFPAGAQLWFPAEPFNSSESRTAHNWNVVGRISNGSSLEQVRQEVDGITKRVVAEATDEDPDYLAVGAATVPLSDQVVGDVSRALFLLLAAAFLVLLVACVNLASTLLARGIAREREMAVRASLGAGKGRIAAQLLTEAVMLAAIGALSGVGLAYLVVEGIRVAGPSFLPRLAEIRVDGTVLAFTALLAMATAILTGILPARRLSRSDPADALRSGGRGNASEGRNGAWRLLVATEVALALVLLVGSGLLLRSFRTVLSEETGFDPEDVAVMTVSLSQLKYPNDADHIRFYDELLGALEMTPGVASAGVVSGVPIQDDPATGRLELDGDLEKTADGAYVVASAGAFSALDIPLLEGRLFDENDGAGSQHVAIVSRSFARTYWPGEDPVGKQVTGGGMDNFYQERVFARVVGVVGDVRYRGLTREPVPTVYFPYSQRPFRLEYGARVVVESASGDARPLVPVLRDVLGAADSDVPIRIRTLKDVVRASLGERRFVLSVLGGFGLTALVLAVVGIFGVVSYDVARRTREMGIRLALGAEASGVRGMVVLGAMRMVSLGLVLGIVGAFALTRTMRAFLYEVSPTDPTAVAAGVVILVAAALLGSWLPARAGTHVDPMVTMRSE